MLVVSRKAGERLLIGGSVEVTVLSVRGDQVSLGVSAPRDVPIHRQELRRAATLDAHQIEQMGASLRAQLSVPTGKASSASGSEPASPPPHESAPAIDAA
jgi:carbon storage regulator